MYSNQSTRISCLVFLLAGLVTAWSPRAALAQSQADLRSENQALRTEVEDLGRELAAANRVIVRLEAELEQLRSDVAARPARSAPARPGASPSTSAPAAAAVTIDESKPNASPRALLRAIVKDYRAATTDKASGEDPDDLDRVAYLRLLRNWASRVNREFKIPIDWHVKLVKDPQRVGRGFVLHMAAVDPETDAELGDPFDVFVNQTLANRLKQWEERFGLDDVLVLKGALTPQVRINESRTDTGPFDNPRFIGLFAEFGFGVNAQALVPLSLDQMRKQSGQRDSSRKSKSASDSDRDSDSASDSDRSSDRDSDRSSDRSSSRNSSSSSDSSSSRNSSSSKKSSSGGG